MAKQAELQKQLSALKQEQTEKFLQGKERVAQERKSRSEQRSAVSSQSQSSDQASSSRKDVRQPSHSSAERRYSRERGPPPLEKSDRSRSRDTQAQRTDSRDRSSGAGSRPSQSENPVTEYHKKVTQETRAYQSTSMGLMPPPGHHEPRWQSSEGRGQEFDQGQSQGWGHWRGRGRGFRPRGWSGPRHGTGGGRFRWSGPRMGRPGQSPSHRQPGYNRPPPKGKEQDQEESSESFYGEHGEYVREEHEDSDKTITPSHSRESSSTRRRRKKKAAIRQAQVKEQKAMWSGSREAEGGQKEGDAPIPISHEELVEEGLNINPHHRMFLVTTSFCKDKVKTMFEKAKLQQYKDITELDRKVQDEKLNKLSGDMQTLIALQMEKKERDEKRRARRSSKKEDPEGPSSSESSESEDEEGEGDGGDRQSGPGEGKEDEEREKEDEEEKKEEKVDKMDT
ncbi:MAG: hypothetical protein GY820_02680, partial [Gammaproteobacteria bacterium]|nr:hypothetical protein [Gammaproteobacteria bacterium]